tara:strand:+ start:1196 stop:1459 length:264 start_codon:yes stop_codon:yes gene_type:complete
MRQYPIWNKVTNCCYQSGKSYGNKEDGKVSILVGSSSMNSHTLCDHRITHKKNEDGSRLFRFSINDKILVEAILKKDANELEFIKTI